MTSTSRPHLRLQPLIVHAVEPPPPGVRRIIPEVLVQMFFREANAQSFGSAEAWTKESAREELTQQMNQGVLGIVWQLGVPSVPVGFAVCEQNQAGLVLSHFYLDPMPREQEVLITKMLFAKVVKVQMRRLGLQAVCVTAPLFSARPMQIRLNENRVDVY